MESLNSSTTEEGFALVIYDSQLLLNLVNIPWEGRPLCDCSCKTGHSGSMNYDVKKKSLRSKGFDLMIGLQFL